MYGIPGGSEGEVTTLSCDIHTQGNVLVTIERASQGQALLTKCLVSDNDRKIKCLLSVY